MRALLIEDDAGVAKSIELMLQAYGNTGATLEAKCLFRRKNCLPRNTARFPGRIDRPAKRSWFRPQQILHIIGAAAKPIVGRRIEE